MSLQVVVVGATNVPNLETFGESDPYAILELQGIKKKTQVIKSQLNPVWNETLAFDLSGVPLQSTDVLNVTIKDWERVGRNRLLGTAKVHLRDLVVTQAKTLQLSVNLQDGSGRQLQSKLTLNLAYTPPPGAKSGQTETGRVVQVGNDYDDETEAEDDMDGDAGDDMADGAIQSKRGKRRRKKRNLGKRKLRSKMSDKPQDYQIRVRVIEARQLQGANIQPVARIKVHNQIRETRVKKSTNSPFWNEVFFFNFHLSPAELFDELFEFQVFNSRKLRSDALIGSFKCDISMVYEEPQHALINKWLLLSDPEDNMAGAKGYLKICATVLGAGDEAPSFKPSTQDDSEDIESNLLRPAGVMLRPATFIVRLYKAEDLPRMDSAFMEGVKKILNIGEEQKELVDPYFSLSFAGKEVHSKTMYCNDHPDWNQELSLGLHFPSMCERLKFVVKDWDRVMDDDTIVTGTLHTNHLSAPGNLGFLPTFGPCYVNLYGSTREYSDLPDEYEHLNMGKGEGVAYRGRVLLELCTVIGELPEEPVVDINSDDILRVQKYQRRRKYVLHAAFLDGTMVSAIDAPVEFEVSIGNYGNKLDENIAPCSSTTQPTNAVFDGCHYYFLPWGDTKPCVQIDSHWEDIGFRLEALNMLLIIADNLEKNINRLKLGIQAKCPVAELAQMVISILDELAIECSLPLPEPQPGYHVANELDRLLLQYRVGELEMLIANAKSLQENATNISDVLSDLENFLQILRNLATEPQNSMPDVVIWMISGERRIAYFRIPAYDLLYAPHPSYRGRQCGKLQTIQLTYPSSIGEKKSRHQIPALLRIRLWLGLYTQHSQWHQYMQHDDRELAVYAETYENQVNLISKWMNKGPTMTRPKWSDSQGKVYLPQDAFDAPSGWRWDSEWYISPELSMLYDRDAGHRHFLDDVYECQSRLPASHWGASSRPWTDVKGDPLPDKKEFVLPEDWQWDDAWQIDLNRAVDEEGWEYCVEATIGGYGPVEKTYHLCRRRRCVRSRTLVVDISKQKAKRATMVKEGWEYAPFFNMKFHAQERTMDLVRRRRWHRKMVADKSDSPCFFSLQTKDEEAASLTAPRMFLRFKKAHKYQLRAYIYQARDLLAGDQSGLSDPFTRVSFLTQSLVTEKLMRTLCPTWDQTLIFEEITIYGKPEDMKMDPPSVVVELFDYDTFGESEFIGRTIAKPLVKLDPGDPYQVSLQWYNIERDKEMGGELLAAFELFLMDGKELPFLPPRRGELFTVPTGIRPVMQRTAIEVLCWGVRNMKKYQLADVTSPSIEFECGGHVRSSTIITNTKKNPNFNEPLLFFDVMLPREELYMPPMNIRIRDHRQFGRKPTVGINVIKSLESFRCQPVITVPVEEDGFDEDGEPLINGGETVVDMPTDDKPQTACFLWGDLKKVSIQPRRMLTSFSISQKSPKVDLLEEDIDWWSKYYASIGEINKCKNYLEQGYDKLQVYATELEKVADYAGFVDFCASFDLSRGKDVDEDDDSNTVGQFKGTFRVYPLPPNPNDPVPDRIMSLLPASAPEECVVRVYIICALDLQPNDPSGLADPYISLILGKKKVNSRDEYIPNSISPVFGKLFELKTLIPIAKDLIIKVKDYDLLSSDDIIGETTIDLENRYLSCHRATCGLPITYCTSGPNQWRDSQKPCDILVEYCSKQHFDAPLYSGNTRVKVGSRSYRLTDFENPKPTHEHLGPANQRLALYVLRSCPLVSEHVETRPLYNPLQPGIEQGKLQMWVDIFPMSLGQPPTPVDIKARKPKLYYLRCIIWNTKDVILEEESITGEKMSDIYVKGWMSGIDEKQSTDVHYRSLDGEGNFNWRMVFPVYYLPAEQTMVVKQKEHFWSLDQTEQRVAPILIAQIWDNDKFSADDFLGTLELNLNSMPSPTKRSGQCDLDMLPDVNSSGSIKLINLFEQKRVRGFWPCYSDESGTRDLTGKVEMSLELVTDTEADQFPSGQGREEPNANPVLDPPNRPETSFLWFTSPFKTLRYIVWKNYKWWIIGLIALLFIIILIIIFLYSFPGELAARLVGSGA